jgi:hypothetical protein
VIERFGVVQVVTLGSTADVTPHTRMPLVVGSTTDRGLATRFALSSPTYQGVTGLVGVLHSELERRRIPSISLRVGVPHYLAMGEHPRAVTTLVLHASHVIGIPLPIDLREAIARWDEVHVRGLPARRLGRAWRPTGRRQRPRRRHGRRGRGRRRRAVSRPTPDRMVDELAPAGPGHLDPRHVEAYERRAGYDPTADPAAIREHGLGAASTLAGLGTGPHRAAGCRPGRSVRRRPRRSRGRGRR